MGIFVQKKKLQCLTAVVYVGTKGPLYEQRERVRGQGTDQQRRSSEREGMAPQDTLIHADSAEMATPLFSTGVQFQSRFAGWCRQAEQPASHATHSNNPELCTAHVWLDYREAQIQ